MNTTSAYLVTHQHPGIELTQTLFTNERLRTARKMALSYVETLLADMWQRGDYETSIEVQLIEFADPSQPIDRPAVARVYRLDLPINPQPCYLKSKENFYLALEQLHQEFLYYQSHGHSMGFGCFEALIEDGEEQKVYCHLYDACGYVNQLTSAYETYRVPLNLPALQTYLTYDDNYAKKSALFGSQPTSHKID